MGVELFQRRARGAVLTREGDAFVAAAREALRALRRIPEAVSAAQGVLSGELSIGVMHGAWGGLDKALLKIRAEHPGVQMYLRQTAASDLVRELREFHVDIAVTALPDRPVPGIRYREISNEPLVLVAAHNTDLPNSTITLQEIADVPYIDLSTAWALRATVDHAFAAAGVTRVRTCELTDINAAAELVRAGLGVTIVPRSLAERFFVGTIRSVRPSLPHWRVGTAQLSGSVVPAAEALARALHGDAG
ncbi:LysR substrate-binding domain-containing protein [Streptomyces sp. NPDC058459]|uniref:LysR substrate-binding domain-containing protein n=1 Tax=Streptomyces sp. NPDC058459 TaxID=3346508 RepID=UPI003653D098